MFFHREVIITNIRNQLIIKKSWILSINIFYFTVDDECTRKYDNARGICRNNKNCKRVRDDYNRGIPITYCAYSSGQAVVCCPENVPSSSIRKSALSKFYLIVICFQMIFKNYLRMQRIRRAHIWTLSSMGITIERTW